MKINLENFTSDYGKAVSYPSAEENNRSFTLDNRSKYIVRKWAIDTVVFKDKIEERCDYLIEIQADKLVYFWIELKGKNLAKACKQILNTISLVDVPKETKQEARIITSGTNKIDIRSIDYLKLSKTIKATGGILRPYTNKGIEVI